jgi:serine/threonine-protein kinase
MAASNAITFGKYRLVAELGQGGMAQVFLALASGPVGFNKLVVLKLIREQFLEDPEFLTMFLDEARLAARLNHPNIVQTTEVGQQDGRYFICMEYLEGQPLNRILARIGAARTDRPEADRLTLGMRLRILVDALAGLHSAHELTDFDGTPLSVVHRDMSPHNLFVTYAGSVKVVDFGIAKALSSSSETRTGVLKGKIGYMAPEQSRGEHVDRRADVFSVGMILWETLTGRRMFKGLPDVAVLQRVMTGDLPSPRSEAPSVPPRLDAICMKALAHDKAARYATAAELGAALEDALEDVDRGSLRDAGRLVERAFDGDRARIKAIVESQISGVKMAPELGFDPVATGSMPRLPMLDQQTDVSSSPTRRDPIVVTGQHVATGTGTARSAGVAPPSELPAAVDARPSSHPSSSSLTANMAAPEMLPRAASSKGIVAGAVVALLVGAGVAAAVFAGRSSAQPAPAASAVGAAGSASAQAASQHELRIESTPVGAKVTEGAVVVGTTPLTVPLPQAGPSRKLVVSLDGYLPATVEQGPATEDVRVLVPLAPAPAAASAEPPAAGHHARPHDVPVAKPAASAPPPQPRPLDIHMER